MATKRVLIHVAAVLLALSGGRARADSTSDDASTVHLRQEIAGVELAPFSVGSGASDLGIGATLRLGRHRWPGFYWTPIQGGFFAGGSGFKETILMKVQTEVGLVLRYGIGTLEAGLGVGPGLVSMRTAPNGCDGSCGVGGQGIMLSPLARFLFRDRASHTVGMFIRAEVPVGSTHGESIIALRGFGMAVLCGLDLAGGWG